MDSILLVIIILILLWFQNFIFNKYAFKNLSYRCYFNVKTAHQFNRIEFVEEVHNNKLLPIPWLKVNISSSKWLDFANSHSTVAQDSRYITSGYFLKGYQKTVRTWHVKCLKRGFYNINNVTLVTGDLFGMGLNSKAYYTPSSLIVYPQGLPIEAAYISKSNPIGDITVKRWINEDPFINSGSKEYTAGEPMNKIHWSATARHQKLMVRNNDYTSSPSFYVILNIQSLDNEKDKVVHKDRIEVFINMAAGFLEKASRNNLPVGFISNSYIDRKEPVIINKDTGKGHIYNILTALAKLKLENIKEFSVLLNIVSENLYGEDIYIMTSYESENINEAIAKLRSGGNKIRVIMSKYIIK